jgi:hypothetical protein
LIGQSRRAGEYPPAPPIPLAPDPDDRRVTFIELTDEGYKLWQSAVGVQARREQLVASTLGERLQEQLNDLLRLLMLSFEDTSGPPPPRDLLESP